MKGNWISYRPRCIICKKYVVRVPGDVLLVMVVGKTEHMAYKCQQLISPSRCMKHPIEDCSCTTWVEWVTTGQCELVNNCQIVKGGIQPWRNDPPKCYMNEYGNVRGAKKWLVWWYSWGFSAHKFGELVVKIQCLKSQMKNDYSGVASKNCDVIIKWKMAVVGFLIISFDEYYSKMIHFIKIRCNSN